MPTKTVLIRFEHPHWTKWFVEKLSARFPDIRFLGADDLDGAMRQAGEANVFMGIAPQIPPQLISAMPNLEWIQSFTSGVDNLLAMEELSGDIPITRVAGVHGPQVSELAILLMMNLGRRFPQLLEAQKRHHWDRQAQSLLYGKTVCILGLGKIAETLAKYCSTMGMRVTGVSDGRTTAPDIDLVYPRAQLAEAAGEADFLVVLIPLSPETRHIVDAAILDAMKPSAFLINVARGGCVDEAALLDALETGGIAGAGFDVFETEPLPSGSPLWQAPNMIVTPHVGGYADIYHEQCYPIVEANVEAYAAGGPGALEGAITR